NGNILLRSESSTVGANANAGHVILINGTTGAEITRIEGPNANYRLGANTLELENGNILLYSSNSTVGANASAGHVILINGTSGAELARIEGPNASYRLASTAPELGSGNILLRAVTSTVGADANAGHVILINGNSGAE